MERARVEDAIFDHDIDTSLKKMFIRNKWIGSTSFSNPKNNQFKIKIILLLMAALGLIASFFISGWFLLIIPLFFFSFL